MDTVKSFRQSRVVILLIEEAPASVTTNGLGSTEAGSLLKTLLNCSVILGI